MKKRQVLGSVFLILLTTYLGVGQTPDVTTKPIKLQLKNVSVQSVLVELAVQSEVSIGFERSDLDGPNSKVSVDETQSTVKELLDHLVKEVPLISGSYAMESSILCPCADAVDCWRTSCASMYNSKVRAT